MSDDPPPDLGTDQLRKAIHDLRTPIITILGYVDQALDLARHHVDLGQRLYGIHDNAHYLLDLLGGISRGTSDPETGTGGPDTIRDCARLLEGFATQHHVTIDYRELGPMPDRLPIGDLALRQICYNLIGNAITYAPRGRVTILTQGFAPDPTSGIGHFTVRFTDQGPGLPPSIAEAPFQAYAHGPDSERGLGLYIAGKLASQAGGRLDVDFTGHEGTSFVLDLPIADPGVVWREPEPHLREATPRPIVPRPALSGWKVLIASARNDQRLFLAALVKRLGARVALADGYAEAVDHVERAEQSHHSWQLALIDCHLPGGRSGELARLLHDCELCQRIIGISTEFEHPPSPAMTLVLNPPFTGDELVEALTTE